MNKRALFILMPVLICASAGAAAGPMQAGLWEVTMKSDAMKNMPQLSAQQMAQMKKRGANVPEMRDGGMVSKICVTKEMAQRDRPPQMERTQKNCQTKNMRKNGDTYTMDVVCNGPELKGTGTVNATYAGNSSFHSIYDFKGKAHGQPVVYHHETSGQWLSADCGNVKPVTSRKK